MLANNLKTLRKKHNLTQVEFAKLFNIDRSAISKWERRINKPSVDQLAEIAKFFKITVDELTGFNKDEELKKFKKFMQRKPIFSKRSTTILLVPIINIALLLSIIISLLVVLVPTYNGYNNQDDDYRLVYSNIESVSLQLTFPFEKTEIFEFSKTTNILDKSFMINYINIIVYDNPANLEELSTKLSVIVEFKNGKFMDLPRANKLRISEKNNYLFEKNGKVYIYFKESGIYNIEFYIKDEIGYIDAYLPN